MQNNTPTRTLVTTLGGQAQVVTFALDWLLSRGDPIGQLYVLHLSPRDSRVRQALDQLALEFPGDQYVHAGKPTRYRPINLADEKGPSADIRGEADAEATWEAVYRVLSELKNEGRPLDLVIAGGRRIMGMMALSAALLLFGHSDRVWHLYTPDELRERAFEGKVRHAAPGEGVHLIRVPFVPWGAYFPALRQLAGANAERIVESLVRQLDRQEAARCQQVMDELTERQRQVLRCFARGSTPQQAAAELNISLKTVDSHKTVILDVCRAAWEILPEIRLDYHFLRDKFRDVVG